MLANFVQETANAPGTAATFNLGGAASGRLPFIPTFASGSTVFYGMDDGTQAEMGIGTVTAGSPNTLTRTTVLWNSAGTTARLNFLGTVRVYGAIPAERAVYRNAAGALQAGADTGAALLASLGLTATGQAVATAADAAAARTAIGATTTGAAVLTAADQAAARTAIGAQAALGFTPVRQGGGTGQGSNVVYIGWDGTGALRLQVDSTDFAAVWPIRASLNAPTPQTSTGLGQWVALSSNSVGGVILPSGGTWAWFGTFNGAGVAAGGTTLWGTSPNEANLGVAWRIA